MLVSFKKVMEQHSHYKSREVKDSLFEEIDSVLVKMYANKIDQAEPWTIKIFQDYRECLQYGLKYAKQRAKVVEALIKYGEGTLFWDELKRTSRQRNREWARVAFVVREVDRCKEARELAKAAKAARLVVGTFRKQVIDWRKKLLTTSLSEAQWKLLFKTEQIIGVYYEGLSPGENGEAWMEREDENGDE